MTTVYEISYLGTYYYTKEQPPEMDSGEAIRLIRVITGLSSSYPIEKRSIAKLLEVRSTELTIIRKKIRKKINNP